MAPDTLAEGRYQLLERIGAGGMATVWRVRDHKLEVDRACKLLTRTGRQFSERFATEARVMAQVRHPNVVQVLDVGVDDDLPWMVMEWVTGGSLQDRLDHGGGLTLCEIAQLGAEVCAGLQAAHAVGIVHRDVKPANVLVTADGSAKVTDFGIARVDRDGAGLTVSGMAMGTLAFMAPEQRQDARHVDERSDVYAVGATLYALATAQRPHELYNPVVARQVYGPVPEPLRPIIERCTRFSPDERYASVAEVAEALGRMPLVAQSTGGARRGLRLAVGLAVGLAGVSLLGLLGVGSGLVAQRLLAPTEAQVEAPPPAPVDPEPVPTPVAERVAEPEPDDGPIVAVAPPPPQPTRVVSPPPELPAEATPDTDVALGAFFVNSVPPARVSIDREDRGGTPVQGELSVGSHVVELTHPLLGSKVLPLVVDGQARAQACWDFEQGASCSRR